MPEDYIKEVSARLSKLPTVVPHHRNASRAGFSFSGLSFEEQLAIWDKVWKNADSFWLRLQAFFFLEKYIDKKDLHEKIWKTIVTWQDYVTDWSLHDCLSKIFTKLLETHSDPVYKQFEKWNKSKDLWKRRQSVVSLLYYTRTKKAILPFEKITALITPLLNDKEYYVQKGVGWTLRELYNAYPKQALAYFRQQIHHISAIAFTAAMEKMEPAEKEKLKLLRKEHRVNARGN